MRKLSTRQLFSVLTLAFGCFFAASALYALPWTGPTANPTGNNVDAPVNVGTIGQVKNGALSVNGFNNAGVSVFDGNVGIGVSNPIQKLAVTGDTWLTGNLVAQGGTVGIGTTNPTLGRVEVHNTGDSNPGNGVFATVSGTNANAIYGQVTGDSQGVSGVATSGGGGTGVFGYNTNSNYSCEIGTPSHSLICNGPTAGLSDERLKEDIELLKPEEGLAAIMELSPVRFHWKDERMNREGRSEIGFTAQNVEHVLPDLVDEVKQLDDAPVKLPDGKVKALSYERLIAPAILAIQQLKAENDRLREEFEAYKSSHP